VQRNSSDQGQRLSVEVVTDSVRLRAVGDHWKKLWARCPDVGLFQSFEYCLDAWEVVERTNGNGLVCLLGWRGDELVAAWPFVTWRSRLWTHARQLVASGVELHELLLDQTVDATEWVQQAWRALIAHSHADVIDFSFSQESASAPALHPLPARAVETTASVCVSVELRQVGDWDDFYNSLSKSYRKDFAKSRRRLEALGPLEFAVLEPGDARIDSLVDWTLEQKRRWAEHTGKKGAWIYSDNYRAFLKKQLSGPGASADNVLMTLTLNGEVLATQIGALSHGRFEAVIAAFDAGYVKHSPGARLIEAVIRWAWERGVDCNLGAGAEPYKLFWSRNRQVAIINQRMAVSRWGVAAFAVRRGAQRLKAARVGAKPERGQE
jgi:CelD/BcsL family acetyltransferase involved in cellulose biosynthesis